MDFTTADDLLKMYGNRNPISNFIFDEQIANQAQNRQLGMQGKGLENRAKELANLYSEQTNPIRALQEQETLSQKRTANRASEFALDKTARTHESDVNQALRDAVSKLKESDLKDLEREAQRLSYSMNPDERKTGLDLLQQHKDFVKIRTQGDEQRKTAAQQQEHAKALETQRAGNAVNLERTRAELGKYNRGTTATTVDQQLAKARNALQAAEILENAYYVAVENNDMAAAARYKERAINARQRAAEDASNRAMGAPGVGLNAQGQFSEKARPEAVAPIAGGNSGNPRANVNPQLPPGAKQVGTSGGKPVYEINGQKFILE